MDDFLSTQFTWWEFFLIAILLVGLYFVLKLLERLMGKFTILKNYQITIRNLVGNTLLIYEAIVWLILGGVFILINPPFHGILVLAVLVGGFSHVKNYFSGRIVQYDNSIAVGKRLKTNESQGIISRTERLGLKLRTKKGLQFINYTKLISDGYTLLSGEEIGGYYQLNILPVEQDEKKNYAMQLTDLLNGTPYIDWNHKPIVISPKDLTKPIKAQVVVREETHLNELIRLIHEWGFTCKVAS